MKRLKTIADAENNIENKNVSEVKILLDRISTASDELKDTYFSLFDNLNALYEAYPNLYKQFEMVVKLPDNDSAKEIVELNKDIKRILNNFNDEEYLKTYL